MKYTASKRTERVTIQVKTVTRNNLGEGITTWSDVATVWAAVMPETGRERIRADRVTSEQAFLVGMAYREDVTTGSRLVWRGRNLEVHGVSPSTRRDEIEIVCTEAKGA